MSASDVKADPAASSLLMSASVEMHSNPLVKEGKLIVTQMTAFDTGLPFLAVQSTADPDPFLKDAPATRINVIVDKDDSGKLVCLTVASASREVVESRPLEDVAAALESLAASRYRACVGYDEDKDENAALFYRVRKTDLPNITIEKYDGNVVYRARKCAYIVENAREDEPEEDVRRLRSDQCAECLRLFAELDFKYCGGRIAKVEEGERTEVEAEEEEEEAKYVTSDKDLDTLAAARYPRKRGRPKGSKNKSFYGGDDYVTSMDVADEEKEGDSSSEVKRIKTENDGDEENDENAPANSLAMEDDPTDADYG
jgi:hypothetical protein